MILALRSFVLAACCIAAPALALAAETPASPSPAPTAKPTAGPSLSWRSIGPAVSGGRVYLASMEALYAIGKKAKDVPWTAPEKQIAPAGAAVAHVQIVPTELLLKPGQKVHLRARLYDAQGRLVRTAIAEGALNLFDTTGLRPGVYLLRAVPTAGPGAPRARRVVLE